MPARRLGVTLMVAGEPSGDTLARAVFPAIRSAGAALYYGPAGPLPGGIERVGTAPSAGMGLASAPTRLGRTALALRLLLQLAESRRVSRVVLFNWTEASAWLGRKLRARGVAVLQVVAPQVFAWRPDRLRTFGESCDALAVLFAFEEPLWRAAGVDATFVGHPLAESELPAVASHELGASRRIALLPGSRDGEIRRLLPAFLGAGELLREDGCDPYVVLSNRVPATRRAAARAACVHARLPVVELAADARLGDAIAGCAVAITASGTATLECALANVPPVIAYRADFVTAMFFRLMARTRWIGLPNILLGRGVFPELLQGAASATNLYKAACGVLAAPPQVREELLPLVLSPQGRSFGEHVAALANKIGRE